MTPVRLLSPKEFRDSEDARMHLARTRLDGKRGASLVEITGPCVMWSCPWHFDPADPRQAERRQRALSAIKRGETSLYLSRFYWEQWSDKRPPISVLCPNGEEWCVDAKSNNGDGWTVEGDAPLLVVKPSIVVHGYHGFLGSNGAQPGHFTGDIEGRGPTGTRRP